MTSAQLKDLLDACKQPVTPKEIKELNKRLKQAEQDYATQEVKQREHLQSVLRNTYNL